VVGPKFSPTLLMVPAAQAFEGFAQSNKDVFDTVGMSYEDVLTKMRLMALLGLGAKASTVSFQDVQVRATRTNMKPWLVHFDNNLLICWASVLNLALNRE